MQWLNPFTNIPTILAAEELIEFAHARSKRVSMKSSKRIPKLERVRIREISRLKEFTKHIRSKLKMTVESFPSLNRLHPFYAELTEILVGIDSLKKALGAVYNCIPVINDITDRHLQFMKLSDDHKTIKRSRSAAKGRIASLVRATAENIDYIIDAKRKLSRLPGVSPKMPTIVCAGFPNVGKSTFVRRVSTADPEVAYYPFTTKEVIIGHLEVDNQSIQIVDTPGILDRPMSQRNEIEQEAVAALKYLAHVIVFMFDPSQACGWSIDDQFNLYNEVRRMFPLIPLLQVLNKIDITPPKQLEAVRERTKDAFEIIATEGVGVEDLIKKAVDEVDLHSLEETVESYLSSITESDSSSFDG